MSTQPRIKVPFVGTKDGLTVYLQGKPYCISKEDPNYETVKDMVNHGSEAKEIKDFIEKEVNKIKQALKAIDGTDVSIDDGVVRVKGEPMHNSLTDRMLQSLEEGFDLGPMARFLQNLMKNPSKRAVDELYSFLEVGELPITPDGCFLAYKAVRRDYKDIHSGTFDNSIGKICEMSRNKVDDDKDRTCSSGLHFCSVDYLKSFARRDGHVMVLKINPADVVSIPSDYNNTKGRCCKYEVVDEYLDFDISNPNVRAWNTAVVTKYDVEGQEQTWTAHSANGITRMSPSDDDFDLS